MRQWIEKLAGGAAQGTATPEAPRVDRSGFAARLRILDRDPYLLVADEALRMISVFDDLRYDRADMDMLSGPMRTRIAAKLKPLGFRQISGMVLENHDLDIRMHMPKFRALGASPFDAIRDTPRRDQDYYILTPTQTACQYIDQYPTAEAVDKIKALVAVQPINILRIMDYLERNQTHQAFLGAIGHLKFVQREAVQAEPLRSRRALR
ncbi:MAG: hypothetical protein AAFQ79_07465 [Pseudomonadota bacterium]